MRISLGALSGGAAVAGRMPDLQAVKTTIKPVTSDKRFANKGAFVKYYNDPLNVRARGKPGSDFDFRRLRV